MSVDIDIEGMTMANRTHLRILSQGVNVWNTWRKNRPAVTPDLSGADLTNRDLSGADFSNANLNGTNFTHTVMICVNLIGASLDGSIGLS